MATMEKMGFGEKTEEEKVLEEQKAKELEEQMKAEGKKEKKSFWSSLGTGVKMGLSFVAGAVAVGATWAITSLLGGGDDEEEPEKIEAPEETKEE